MWEFKLPERHSECEQMSPGEVTMPRFITAHERIFLCATLSWNLLFASWLKVYPVFVTQRLSASALGRLHLHQGGKPLDWRPKWVLKFDSGRRSSSRRMECLVKKIYHWKTRFTVSWKRNISILWLALYSYNLFKFSQARLKSLAGHMWRPGP